jgi:hypothetical protein
MVIPEIVAQRFVPQSTHLHTVRLVIELSNHPNSTEYAL